MHRAETQRRRENQNQDLVALACEKQLKDPFCFNPAQRDNIRGFPAELDCSIDFSLKEDISASLREKNFFYGKAEYL